MTKLFGLAACAAVVLSGCAASGSSNSRGGLANVDRAVNACDVTTLAEEKKTLDTNLAETRRNLGLFSRSTASDQVTVERKTRFESRVRRYDAELDASYRFATQNCRAYMQCLESQRFDENQCVRSEIRWADSQREFSSLMTEIRQINAEVTMTLAEIESRKPCCNGKGNKADRDEEPEKKKKKKKDECCDVVNSVFTDCCD